MVIMNSADGDGMNPDATRLKKFENGDQNLAIKKCLPKQA